LPKLAARIIRNLKMPGVQNGKHAPTAKVFMDSLSKCAYTPRLAQRIPVLAGEEARYQSGVSGL
jgi:hypothetical protein